MIKICKICGETFEGNKGTKYCSDACRKKGRKAYEKQYYQDYKEKIKAYNKEYVKNHKEQVRRSYKKYYYKKKERLRKQGADSRLKHSKHWNCGYDCNECPYPDCIY